jgi:hypothetical protein
MARDTSRPSSGSDSTDTRGHGRFPVEVGGSLLRAGRAMLPGPPGASVEAVPTESVNPNAATSSANPLRPFHMPHVVPPKSNRRLGRYAFREATWKYNRFQSPDTPYGKRRVKSAARPQPAAATLRGQPAMSLDVGRDDVGAVLLSSRVAVFLANWATPEPRLMASGFGVQGLVHKAVRELVVRSPDGGVAHSPEPPLQV